MQALVACVVLAVCACAMAYTTQEYCNLCSDHTMCQYSGVNSRCLAGVSASGVSSGDQATILNAHNFDRNRVASGAERRGKPGPQPSASNMKTFSWNSDVAAVAQRWADQCLFQHDSCRNTPQYYVGQNLFISSISPCDNTRTQSNWTQAVEAWYEEVVNFNNSIVDKYQFDSATGHYTQVVWANTYNVGCGFRVFQDGSWCRRLYVCNYGPGGNFIGQPVYQRGSPRTACSSTGSANPSYPALC